MSPVGFATILIGLADYDAAIDWMERSFEDRRGWLVYLNVNPILDPVRNHDRFQSLVRRIRFSAGLRWDERACCRR